VREGGREAERDGEGKRRMGESKELPRRASALLARSPSFLFRPLSPPFCSLTFSSSLSLSQLSPPLSTSLHHSNTTPTTSFFLICFLLSFGNDGYIDLEITK